MFLAQLYRRAELLDAAFQSAVADTVCKFQGGCVRLTDIAVHSANHRSVNGISFTKPSTGQLVAGTDECVNPDGTNATGTDKGSATAVMYLPAPIKTVARMRAKFNK